MNHLGTKIMEALQGLDKVYAPIKAELGALEHKITAGRQSVEDLQRYGELDFACRPFLEVVEGLIFVQELMKEAGDKVKAAELGLELKSLAAHYGILQLPVEEFLQGDALDVKKIEALIVARNTARAEKNWVKSDEIRDELKEMGVILEDKSGKTEWRKV